MSLEGFVHVLDRAGLDLDADNLREALWLASRGVELTLHQRAEPTPDAPPPPPPPDIDPPPVPPPSSAGGPAAPPAEGATAPPVSVYPKYRPSAGDRTVKATPVAIPAGRSLPHRLEFMRAMRPLCERWPSRQFSEIDEEKTVEASAQWRSILPGTVSPVFRRRRERWFDVEVVTEDDDAIEVWAETLRDFCQVLRDTGAFRAVRSWRLRMGVAGGTRTMLENTTGAREPVTYLTGHGVRRLVIFATHGASARWLDGSYVDILKHWLRDCSALLLQLTPPERWSQTRLGDAHGLCSAKQPGAVAAALEVQPFWWNIEVDADNPALLPVPVVPLVPAALDEWAHMQMSRGRQSHVYLLDPRRRIRPVARGAAIETERDAERAVAELRRVSATAFQLAVWLSPTAFTIPVARLVHDTQFGASADPRPIADLLQSGLVVAHGRHDGKGPALQYDFRPMARRVLMRSLREADARQVASDLRRRVSQYIAGIAASPHSSVQLVPDPAGREELPDWAQPFAEAAAAILGLPERSAEGVQEPVGGAEPDRRGAITRLIQALRALAATRMRSDEPVVRTLDALVILWVDDRPSNNAAQHEHLRTRGARLVPVESTLDALAALEAERIDIVVSDMARGDEAEAGLDLLARLRQREPQLPVIIFADRFARERSQVALDAGAFGCTNQPATLYRLVQEAAGTVRARPAAAVPAWLGRVREALVAAGLPAAEVDPWLDQGPFGATALAKRLLARHAEPDIAFARHLQVVQACASSSVNQLIVVDQERLVVAASVNSANVVAPQRVVEWTGMIRKAAQERKRIWLEDAAKVTDFVPAESMSRSALVVPIFDARGSQRMVAVLNVEMAWPEGLAAARLDWLSAFAEALAYRLPTDRPITWLSFEQADRDVAVRLSSDLERRGRLIVMFAAEAQLNVNDAILLIASAASMSADGRFPASSLAAREEFRSLVPVFVEGAPVPPELTQLPDVIDLRTGHDRAVQQLAQLLAPKGGLVEPGQRPQQPASAKTISSLQLEIVYATDRAPIDSGKDGEIRFGAGRASGLSYGLARVSVPAAHRVGAIERPNSLLFFRFNVDRSRHFDLLGMERVGEGQLANDLFPAMGNRSRSTLVYIPGFNVDFETGVFRTAQIAADLRSGLSPVLFSWPSQGKVLAYGADREAAPASAPHLARWLAQLDSSLASAVHLWADGLGALVLIRALLASEARALRFGQIVLTRPDVDLDEFDRAARQIATRCERLTVYVSENAVLSAARTYAGAPRAGATLRVVAGIDTVHVGEGGLAELSSAVDVLADIRAVLQGDPVSARSNLRRLESSQGPLWQLGDGSTPTRGDVPEP